MDDFVVFCFQVSLVLSALEKEERIVRATIF